MDQEIDMTNFSKHFQPETLVLAEDKDEADTNDTTSSEDSSQDDDSVRVEARDAPSDSEDNPRIVDLTMTGSLPELCAYADKAISEGYVSEVHVTGETGKSSMRMEYDEAVSTFLTDLVTDDGSPDRKLEFTLKAQ